MADTILGFDIGTYGLKIARWDGKSVSRLVEVPMPDSMVKKGVIISFDAMADFIKKTLKEEKISGRSASVILPSRDTILRRLEMPLMTTDQLEMNLPYEFHDFLTEDKGKYYYDYFLNLIKEEKGEDGAVRSIMDITAAAVPKSTVDDYRAMFKRAGLRLKTAIPLECAYANILTAAKAEPEHEYCIINLGHDVTRVDIFKGNLFQTTRIIEIGLSRVDEQIAAERNIDSHVARTHIQSNLDGAQETENALTVYGAIAADVRKTINFYQFSNRDSELTEAWCCGGGTHIKALLSAISQATSLELRSAAELLNFSGKSDAGLVSYAPVIGAVLQ